MHNILLLFFLLKNVDWLEINDTIYFVGYSQPNISTKIEC